ncbi:MAG: 16S rRNA (adenine(1518)-N(6)/adenine(1519)-N(6))-dimethyltransferase RsmA [Oscillospiraceae bacterium]|nr:16S rRNA (adenine(1518)-N(6)/adenine(1519)-N(6))-dimethyltransferase RsmA [Oscillospiraceae bacterium]
MDVCNMQQIKLLLAKYGFHFSKSKGQNFLNQRWVPEQIVQGSQIDKDCGVIEIGPGFGPLTQELCKAAGKVVALELDTTLKPVLAETVGEFDNLEIIFTDAMKVDLPALVEEKFQDLRPAACANLPYYITSPVLTKLLESKCFSSVTVMVQKEVAQRICAKAGAGDYSSFTVLCNYYGEPELLFDVPAHCFIPQPKVTSAVVRLKIRKDPPAEILDEGMFFRTVRAAFAQRRKTLLNCLSASFGEFGKEELTRIMESVGLAPSIRGETLDIPQFAALSNALLQAKEGK